MTRPPRAGMWTFAILRNLWQPFPGGVRSGMIGKVGTNGGATGSIGDATGASASLG